MQLHQCHIAAADVRVECYGLCYHRSIVMAPSEVTSTNQETVWQRLYGHESGGAPKFRVGDRVIIII